MPYAKPLELAGPAPIGVAPGAPGVPPDGLGYAGLDEPQVWSSQERLGVVDCTTSPWSRAVICIAREGLARSEEEEERDRAVRMRGVWGRRSGLVLPCGEEAGPPATLPAPALASSACAAAEPWARAGEALETEVEGDPTATTRSDTLPWRWLWARCWWAGGAPAGPKSEALTR